MAVVNRHGMILPISAVGKTSYDSGKCFQFDGATSHIVESATVGMTVNDPITICGRIMLEADSTNSFSSQPIVIARHIYVHVRLISSAHTLIGRFDNGSSQQAGIAIDKNAWYSFVCTMENLKGQTLLRMYVMKNRGVYTDIPQVGGIISSPPTNGNAKADSIGLYGSYFNGKMDDIMEFKRILSYEEIFGYCHGKIPDLNQCVLFYKADDETANVAKDSSPLLTNGVSSGVTYVTNKVFNG